jgi:hypothetical protein
MCKTCSLYGLYETRKNKSGKARKIKVAGTIFEVRRYELPRKITLTNRKRRRL